MLSPDEEYMINQIAEAVAKHMRQDQQDLNRELQERSYRALLQVRMAKIVDDEDFRALCFAAGHSYHDIDRQIDVLNVTLRG